MGTGRESYEGNGWRREIQEEGNGRESYEGNGWGRERERELYESRLEYERELKKREMGRRESCMRGLVGERVEEVRNG